MIKPRPLLFGILAVAGLCLAQTPADVVQTSKTAPLTGRAADLYRKAKGGKWFADADKLKPTILPTSDGQSFFVVWKASPQPKRWLVSLHGSSGFATDDLALWHPHLRTRDVGVICVQWLKDQGALVLDTLEDDHEGHGALVRNAKNAKHVLDLFCLDKPEPPATPSLWR